MTKKEQVINELVLTYLKKNKDYGNSATETFKLFGEQSYLIRLHDKLKRIERLLHSDAEVQEKIDDTILDLIVYDALFYTDECGKEERLSAILSAITFFLESPKITVNSLINKMPQGFNIDGRVIDYIVDYVKIITR